MVVKTYSIKWNNGYWKVFDDQEYTDAFICKSKEEAKSIIKSLLLPKILKVNKSIKKINKTS